MNYVRTVIWSYLDTEKATVKAMRDYRVMEKLKNMLPQDESNLNDIDILRLIKVNEYLNWFEPAWNSLSEENKLILKEFYMSINLKSGAGVRLQFKLNYSERQLHRIRGKAISELAMVLFGRSNENK